MTLSKFLKSPFEFIDQNPQNIIPSIGFLSENDIAASCTIIGKRKTGHRYTDNQDFWIVLERYQQVVLVGYTHIRENDNIPGIYVTGIVDLSEKVAENV